jgi:hypothetical protein
VCFNQSSVVQAVCSCIRERNFVGFLVCIISIHKYKNVQENRVYRGLAAAVYDSFSFKLNSHAEYTYLI